MVSDFTLQLTIKKLPLVEFLCSITKGYPKLSEKAIQRPLPFSNCERPDFFHTLQPKCQVSTDWMQKEEIPTDCF